MRDKGIDPLLQNSKICKDWFELWISNQKAWLTVYSIDAFKPTIGSRFSNRKVPLIELLVLYSSLPSCCRFMLLPVSSTFDFRVADFHSLPPLSIADRGSSSGFSDFQVVQ